MGIDAGRAVDLTSIVSKPKAPTDGGAGGHSGLAAGNPNGQSGTELMLPALVLQADDATFTSVVDISNTVPVLVCFVMDSATDENMVRALSDAVFAQHGRVILVNVDSPASPQLVASFQADAVSAAEGGSTPVVAAVIAGRPLPLFAGEQPADVISQVVAQLITVAEQNGVSGTVVTPSMMSGDGQPVESSAAGATSQPAPVPLAPLHQEAIDAIERADFEAAKLAYQKALKENPNDEIARAGFAQVSLLARLKGKSLADVRNAAASRPTDLEPQLDVADLDISGGHIDDAFDRLLGLFPGADKVGREMLRVRLLELFEVVGATDPRVIAARAKLTGLLF